jgi:predicted DNA-binding transcriptional regulator AlpA
MASEPVVLTVKEVCGLIRIHRSTIYRLVSQGKIPGFKILAFDLRKEDRFSE